MKSPECHETCHTGLFPGVVVSGVAILLSYNAASGGQSILIHASI